MIMLSSTEMWLLHSIVSMFLWITFIGLIFLVVGLGIYTVEKFIGTSENDNKNDKGDKNNGQKRN